MTSEFLEKEIYLIPVAGKYTLVYAPLTRIFSLYKGSIKRNEIDFDVLSQAINPDNIPDFAKKGFATENDRVKLRANLTARCNLKCSYCSVNGIGSGKDMSVETALRMTDQFIDYAKELGAKEIELTFSGGEPTLKIGVIEKVINHALKKIGPIIHFSPRILSNGVFLRQEIAQVLNSIEGVQISWDGNSAISPRYNQREELERIVWHNIGFLIQEGIPPNILTVVSEKNFLHIESVVNELSDTFGLENISLAFLDRLGRGRGAKGFDYRRFGKIYMRLWKKFNKKGLDINLSGTDIHSIGLFPCSIAHPNFSVSPDGTISSCTVTFNDTRKFADFFKIGQVSEVGLRLNTKTIHSMKRFNVLNLRNCQTCFAKWHCRGGCVYAKNGRWFGSLNEDLCRLIREIILEKLLVEIGFNC